MLEAHHITKTFHLDNQYIHALSDVSFEVKTGEFFTCIGPSGCGKSTLLRIIAGLDTLTSGNLVWDQNPDIGFVFQHYALFPFLNVLENIAFGLKMQGVCKKDRYNRAASLIDEVGLTGFADKHPRELSGGMKQRVGIARALAINPNLLLLDEPFSSLDEFTAEVLRDLLLTLWEKRKMTVILITHSVKEAITLSDRIAVCSSAPGTIKKVFENTFPRPRNSRSKNFFKLEDTLVQLIHT